MIKDIEQMEQEAKNLCYTKNDISMLQCLDTIFKIVEKDKTEPKSKDLQKCMQELIKNILLKIFDKKYNINMLSKEYYCCTFEQYLNTYFEKNHNGARAGSLLFWFADDLIFIKKIYLNLKKLQDNIFKICCQIIESLCCDTNVYIELNQGV